MAQATRASETGRRDATAGSAAPSLPLPVPGERRETERRAGRLAYYVAGEGRPLLLIHSINAAASAYEIRPIFEHCRARHRVYAVDLPGYGASDRSPRDYTPGLFADAVRDMVEVIAEENGGAPIDALAISLSSEFLARVAAEWPERFRTLALITPTGFNRGADGLRAPPGTTREMPRLRRFLERPWVSRPLFRLLVCRRSIRYFLRRTFGSRDVDPGLVDYAYLTAHQPGARHAPLAFLSGRLFSRDIRDVYERLTQPIWLAHATRGDFKDFSEVGWTQARGNWTVRAFPTGALPHFEEPETFLEEYEAFLAGTGG